jgi:hypothetical protein
MFETAFSEGIFWSSIISGGESWSMAHAPSQRHNDKAQAHFLEKVACA